MSKEEFDLDKEVEKIARKSNVHMRKTEYSFENRIRKLDEEIDKILDRRIKEFDENKKLTSEYLSIDYSQDSIERYREKLKKI